MRRLAGALGRQAIQFLRHTSGVTLLCQETLRYILSPSLRTLRKRAAVDRATIDQMNSVGAQSLPIVAFLAFLVGLIIAMQTFFQIAALGAESRVGGWVAVAMIRTIGPLLTAIVIAARVGSAFTAEIGTMKISEEILALETMGLSPVCFLIVPRLIAAVVMVPALTMFADLFGILGGLAVAVSALGMSIGSYLQSASEAIAFKDLWVSLLKSVVFGGLITMIACYRALIVRGGSREVGSSTMVSVVGSIVGILVAEFIFTAIFYYSFYIVQVPLL